MGRTQGGERGLSVSSYGHKSWLEEGEGLSKPGVSPDSWKPLPSAKQRTGPRNVHRDWGGLG